MLLFDITVREKKNIFTTETSYPCRISIPNSGVPTNFIRGGGSTNSFEDGGQRERGSGGSSTLVRGSGGSCDLIQEISFHIVTFSYFLVL